MAGCENVKMGKAWLPPRLSYALGVNPVSLEKSSFDPDITDGEIGRDSIHVDYYG